MVNVKSATLAPCSGAKVACHGAKRADSVTLMPHNYASP